MKCFFNIKLQNRIDKDSDTFKTWDTFSLGRTCIMTQVIALEPKKSYRKNYKSSYME